jgi:hypothetical protein
MSHPSRTPFFERERGSRTLIGESEPKIRKSGAEQYFRPMHRKPIEIPPAAAKAFLKDMRAFHAVTDPSARLFAAMKDQA